MCFYEASNASSRSSEVVRSLARRFIAQILTQFLGSAERKPNGEAYRFPVKVQFIRRKNIGLDTHAAQ